MSDTDPYAKYRRAAPLELPVEVIPEEPPPQDGPMQPVVPPQTKANPYGKFQQTVQPGVIGKAPVGPIGQGADPVKLPDKYDVAAEEEAANLDKLGGYTGRRGYIDRLVKGAGAGWTDDLMAGGAVPFEMIKRGTVNPAEAYRYTRAREEQATKRIQQETEGPLGAAAEVAGGVLTGGQVLASGPRIGRTVNALGQQLSPAVANYLANVGKGGLLGAFAGAGEAPRGKDIPQGALGGGLIGGAVGGAVQPVAKVIHAAGSATLGATQATRLRNSDNVAIEQLEKVVRDSGQTMAQVAQKVRDAHAAGQTEYSVFDAIGKEGYSKLTALNKLPGATRDTISEFLTGRTNDMGVRTSHEVRRALGAPYSAERSTDLLIDTAKRNAGPLYAEAEKHPAWSERIQEILDSKYAKAGLKQGLELQEIEAIGRGTKFDPTDTMVTHFNEAGDPVITGVPNLKTLNTLKVGLDKIIEKNTDEFGRVNAEGRAYVILKKGLIDAIDDVNPAYREARRAFAGPMEVKDAVKEGRNMARSDLAEDTLRDFRAASPTEQQGRRIGYASEVREPLEKGTYPTLLRDKSHKGQTELNELSLYQGPRRLDPRTGQEGPDQLRQFLTREQEMQKGANAAMGGSDTAEKLAGIGQTPGGADALNAGIQIATGNPMGAGRSLLELGWRTAKGESEHQRAAIARMLMAREPADVQDIARRFELYDQARRGVDPRRGTWRIPPGQ